MRIDIEMIIGDEGSYKRRYSVEAEVYSKAEVIDSVNRESKTSRYRYSSRRISPGTKAGN